MAHSYSAVSTFETQSGASTHPPTSSIPLSKPAAATLTTTFLLILLIMAGVSTNTSTTSTTPSLSSAPLSTSDHLVKNLPGLPTELDHIAQFSGFLPITPDSSSELFYWLIASEKNGGAFPPESTLPLVIWLNGGPGASSLTGLLLENGPFRLGLDASLTYNPFGWTQEAHFVAIDNPVGAGFSFTDNDAYVNSLDEMAEQLFTGILALLDEHPWLADSPVFITGESYAGKYIPAISHYIYKQNLASDTPLVNLEGLAIGNGELKPYTAYASTPDYLRNLGLIDDKQQAWAHERLVPCKEQVDNEQWIEAFKTCQDVEDDLYAKFVQIPFIYDIRSKTDEFTDLTAVVTSWINTPEVHAALNVGDRPWRQSDGQGPSSIGKPVPEHLKGDEMVPIPDSVIVDLITNFRVMFYSGQYVRRAKNLL
ncbi:hypothetical protein TeGR_g3785, partial [Tetraparma gracilis]